MNLILHVVVGGLVVPAAVGCLAACLMRRWWRSGWGARCPLAVGVVAGFWSGYLLLPWAPLIPQSSWQRLPYVVLGGAIAGTVMQRPLMSPLVRRVVLIALSAAAALCLVPDLAELRAHRIAWLTASACSAWALTVGVDHAAGKFPDRLHQFLLAVTALTAAVLLGPGLSGSIKMMQLGGIAWVTFAALLPAARSVDVQASAAGPDAAALHRTAAPAQSLLLGGLLLGGYFYSSSEVPPASYLLVAAAPVAQLAAVCWPTLRDGSAVTVARIRLAAVLAVLAAGIVLAAVSVGGF